RAIVYTREASDWTAGGTCSLDPEELSADSDSNNSHSSSDPPGQHSGDGLTDVARLQKVVARLELANSDLEEHVRSRTSLALSKDARLTEVESRLALNEAALDSAATKHAADVEYLEKALTENLRELLAARQLIVQSNESIRGLLAEVNLKQQIIEIVTDDLGQN